MEHESDRDTYRSKSPRSRFQEHGYQTGWIFLFGFVAFNYVKLRGLGNANVNILE